MMFQRSWKTQRAATIAENGMVASGLEDVAGRPYAYSNSCPNTA